MSATETRESILKRLREDLLGPISADEVLEQRRPLDTYLTGILWPVDTPNGAEDDDGEMFEEGQDPKGAPVSVFGQMKPSTMGVTFALNLEGAANFSVDYSFGVYIPTQREEKEGIENELWTRHEVSGRKVFLIEKDSIIRFPIEVGLNDLNVSLYIRIKKTSKIKLVTVTLVNLSKSDVSKKDGNSKSLFQTHLVASAISPSQLAGLPDETVPIDEDEESLRLLYSNEVAYAVGHQCSATWSSIDDKTSKIESDWMPAENVPVFSQNGHIVFSSLTSSGKLAAKLIASQDYERTLSTLKELIHSYGQWINDTSSASKSLDAKFEGIAAKNLNLCRIALERMENGIKLLSSDPSAFLAFQLANEAMSLQHDWKVGRGLAVGDLNWRPFQLAFILMTIESVSNSESSEREILDLLWFPTGGGKTEAYLAIIAFGALYQRLTVKLSESDLSNFAIMRYTLRLLTAQQFERASALILALDLIRQNTNSESPASQLGEKPFSIGLWVGKDATPNTFTEAKEKKGSMDGASAEQLRECFSCGKRLTWEYRAGANEVRPKCTTVGCVLGQTFGLWPIATVDEDIYNLLPTLLIGTVDKFAQLPRKKELRKLFGFRTPNATQLIIQDELHLISGPLGTVVGAYEVAIDWLLSFGKARPKVIGSTATIRRAESQVRALFDRKSAQFPPSGISYKDSGFAVVDDIKPGRIYVGLSNAGRSAKFTLQAVAGSLLQSGGVEALGDVDSRDGYTTLLMYFNNLRELGGAIVQILDDVPDSVLMYSKVRQEVSREVNNYRELTSTRSQSEILEILEDMGKAYSTDESLDVVLATNMVSVGVDVPRLGLMQLNGQPKTRSEYIQSTSRVGRANSPGLVVVVHNVLRARDRSHFETFASWHRRLYRDVEATSVTPFASRCRDRTLPALVATMVRHGDPAMLQKPDLTVANPEILREIVTEIYRRAKAVAPEIADVVLEEVRKCFDDWSGRTLEDYYPTAKRNANRSLLQGAEQAAKKRAIGLLPGYAWPIMNSMRSVEPDTPFRMKDKRTRSGEAKTMTDDSGEASNQIEIPPWRS